MRVKTSSLPYISTLTIGDTYTIIGEHLDLLPDETLLFFNPNLLPAAQGSYYYLKMTSKTPTTAVFAVVADHHYEQPYSFRYFATPHNPPRVQIEVEYID